jgi:beta-glucanase (GH16 family)
VTHVKNLNIFIAVSSISLISLLAACGGGGSSSPTSGGAVASSSSSSVSTGPGQTAINEAGGLPTGYTLNWADEFNTDGLPDPALWSYDTSRNMAGWYNNEKQYYANARLENSHITGGHLVIEARKEALNTGAFPDWGGQAYSSARMMSKKTWTYGYVEVRAWVPCSKGSWPAIWTLPAAPHQNWPDDGEVDIMEYVGWNAGQIYQTVHTKDYYFTVGTQKSVITPVADACSAWHTYQMTWTQASIKLGIDGRNYLSFKNDGTGNYNEWPFVNPQYLILNLAVGGDFGGQQGIDDASLPWDMLVDYVRVYKAS